MKGNRKLFIFLLTVAFLLPLLSLEVLANAPPEAELTGVVELPDSLGIALLILFSIPGIVVTIISEWMVAGIFGMQSGEQRMVRRVNLISQILMRIVFVFLNAVLNLSYLTSVVVLEIAVYMLEYLVYRRLIKSFSAKKIFAYTIAANTVSLLLGMLMNDLFLLAKFTGGI